MNPHGPEPWVKHATGGSDDHSGLYLAAAYTETPPAATVAEYLAHLRRGEHRPGGTAGSSLKLARCFYSIALEFLERKRGGRDNGSRGDLVSELLRRVLDGGEAPRSWSSRVRTGAARIVLAGKAAWTPDHLSLAGEMLKAAALPASGSGSSVERRCLETANRLTEAAVAAGLDRAAEELEKAGRLAGAFRAASELVPRLTALAPYLASFHTQHKDDAFLGEIAARFPAARGVAVRPKKKAWFTDTLTEINGVARTIRETAALARRQGLDLAVVTSTSAQVPEDLPVHNFRPVREYALPEYESLPLALPPFLELLDHCERQGFTEIVLSTPGPMGLAGLAIAKLLDLPAVGIYHTDFPAYAGLLTGNPMFDHLAQSYMKWFYGACARVYAPSRAYVEALRRAGIEPERLRLLPRGVDHRLLPPRPPPAGAMARVRPLQLLPLPVRGPRVEGEEPRPAAGGVRGPARPRARRGPDRGRRRPLPRRAVPAARRPADPLHRLPPRAGLAAAYASADVFVFPSATDTFGNAVLEAHACGLPAVVADAGGPPEIVREHRSGLTFGPGSAAEPPPPWSACWWNPTCAR